jgi:hypothetical protein
MLREARPPRDALIEALIDALIEALGLSDPWKFP